MDHCRLCHFPTERDDVVLRFPSGACLCLRCYGRETDSARPMPTALRQQLHAVLSDIAAAA